MARSECAPILRVLRELGLLLQQDKALPNVVALVLGETLTGSYWSHPRAHTVFRCLTELAEHRDVLQTKLISGKVTFVHRRLWPALLALATAREPWQLQGLPAEAKALLKQVDRQREMMASGKAAKELERRLLVHGEQVHTDAGHHETRLETWPAWSERVGCQVTVAAEEGRRQLEEAVRAVGGVGDVLPWEGRFKRGPR